MKDSLIDKEKQSEKVVGECSVLASDKHRTEPATIVVAVLDSINQSAEIDLCFRFWETNIGLREETGTENSENSGLKLRHRWF